MRAFGHSPWGAWVVWCFAIGCGGPPPVDFGQPDLLGPLEAQNQAPQVPGQPGDPFPEALAFASGEDTANDWYWAHARGWVHAGCGPVWQALRDPEVVVDRREVASWTARADVEPDFDFSFAIDNTVHNVVTVAYELTWVHQLHAGTVDQPERAVIRWDKTDGTAFIPLLSGSVLLRGVDAGLCEIELIEHLRAPARDEQTLVQYLTDLHASVVARVHGQPLPAW